MKKAQKIIKNSIELEIRSIFLQGLLLENPETIPKKFFNYYQYFKKLDNISKYSELSKITVALGVLKIISIKK